MNTINYSKIAYKYDKNQYRREEIRYEAILKEYMDNNCKTEYQVLDLSCGTGLYLEKQIDYFKRDNIKWYGLDASKEMLDIAKKRLERVSLTYGYAEEMSYQSGIFDFISNNYAFHHYKNKSQALDEVYRVLTDGGIFKLHNIAIHKMKKWWLYHYFPTAYYEDLKRFWNIEVIFNELTKRGFEVEIQIEYQMTNIKVADYLQHVLNKDISILNLINDKDYEAGLERIHYDVTKNPDKTIVNDFAELFCFSKKV